MTLMREPGVLVLLVAGLVACGAPASPPPAQPGAQPAAAPEPSCEDAARVVETIASERGGKFRDEAAAMTEVVRTRCREDGWTVESRRCMARAASRDDARDCVKQLTEAQQDGLKRGEQEMRGGSLKDAPHDGDAEPDAEPAAGATPSPTMAPPSPPPAPARAPAAEKKQQRSAPKADKARSDPCEGGE